ncbi:MAG TPA: HAD family hydrolase [Ilumatobacteraceae bacterium]|nr:HAD family hydrolase [Ilumatobacteraceae bacterium]
MAVRTTHDVGLVIFDCDGVLVDSERLTVVVEARMLTELGWPITTDEVVRRFVGGSSAAMLAEIERHLGPELTQEFDRRSTEEIVAAFHAELQPVAGVRELVESLHLHGVLTCVASSGSHRKMDLTLGLTGLRQLFDGRIYSASDVARGKPWPDLFLHAARVMDVDPSRCVVIEDSITGARAAIAAGMTCYGFAGGLSPRGELQASGTIVFDTMSELREVLLAVE